MRVVFATIAFWKISTYSQASGCPCCAAADKGVRPEVSAFSASQRDFNLKWGDKSAYGGNLPFYCHFFSGPIFWRDGRNKHFFKEFWNSTLSPTVSSSSTENHSAVKIAKNWVWWNWEGEIFNSHETLGKKGNTHAVAVTRFASLLNSYILYVCNYINQWHIIYIYIHKHVLHKQKT